MVQIAVRQLDPELPLPVMAHVGDAGVDLYARQDVIIAPVGGRVLVPTGIAIAIPDGYVGLVVPRSGLAMKHGVTLVNTPGIIDSGYRGELQVVMINTDPTIPYSVKRGDRIAQLMIQRIETVTWMLVDELDGNDRGGGFGHSGR
ncbi:MAG: dUTP diphosphatase [Ilumatobacteraceae bacterium]